MILTHLVMFSFFDGAGTEIPPSLGGYQNHPMSVGVGVGV